MHANKGPEGAGSLDAMPSVIDAPMMSDTAAEPSLSSNYSGLGHSVRTGVYYTLILTQLLLTCCGYRAAGSGQNKPDFQPQTGAQDEVKSPYKPGERFTINNAVVVSEEYDEQSGKTGLSASPASGIRQETTPSVARYCLTVRDPKTGQKITLTKFGSPNDVKEYDIADKYDIINVSGKKGYHGGTFFECVPEKLTK